ncbi:hypothetical protein [Burkholderia pseudomallei]|uniref:hypothetical protein n=1 Tax=Burkholderia pseudomallei TaxID=28450 RepID=UPI0016050090|nr:hypothetical protein [Burkholderia pseudomallei]
MSHATATLPTPAELCPAEVHRILLSPDGLADAFQGLDCAAAAQMVEQLAVHLHTAKQVDAVGIIDELTSVCVDERPGQSARRNLSHAVAACIADCMRFVDDDDAEIIIEFVMWAPLTYGFDLLCKVGAAYGLVRGGIDGEPATAARDVAHITATGQAIEIWRQRARRSVASGYAIEQGELCVLLDGLARLGVDATDADALAALSEFCSECQAGSRTFSNKPAAAC